MDLKSAIALLRQAGYRVTAPSKPKAYIPMGHYEIIFADGMKVLGQVISRAGKWNLASMVRAACDRYRYRHTMRDIDAWPVPLLVSARINNDFMAVDSLNAESEDYRRASANRYAA